MVKTPSASAGDMGSITALQLAISYKQFEIHLNWRGRNWRGPVGESCWVLFFFFCLLILSCAYSLVKQVGPQTNIFHHCFNSNPTLFLNQKEAEIQHREVPGTHICYPRNGEGEIQNTISFRL